jgi:hypothetical protein
MASLTQKAITSLFLTLTLSVSFAFAHPWYVSLDGNDENPGSEAKPFATIARAKEEVRKYTEDMSGNLIVYIREGVHFQTQTLHFDENDGGTNGFNVMYVGYPNEEATISGGKKLTGWSGGGVMTASTGGKLYRQLYVNDKAAIKADGSSGAAVEQIWEIHGHWSHAYLPQGPDGAIVRRAQLNFDALTSRHSHFVVGARNSPAGVGAPGTFATDYDKVYYAPRAGEDMSSVDAIVPVLDPLILCKGKDMDHFTTNIIFQNLSFAHATWTGFDTAGLAAVQVGHAFFTDGAGQEDSVWLDRTPGGIMLERAQGIRFEKCVIKCMGSGGIDFARSTKDCAVTGCTFRDIGANAVAVAPAGSAEKNKTTNGMFNPVDDRERCDNIEVSHCYVNEVSYEFKGCVGIFAGFPTRFKCVHNKVWDLPYTGISMGWGWNPDTANAMRENVMRANWVADCMRELIDGGLIYTLSGQPGTIVDSNYLAYDIAARGNFFYLDAGSSFFEVAYNGTHGCAYSLGMGFDCYGLRIHDNYFEWGNYWSSNGTLQNESTYDVQVTNTNLGGVPEWLSSNAGPKEASVTLTPVSVRPGLEHSTMKSSRLNKQVCQIYDLKGRRVATLDIRGGTHVADLLRRKHSMPAGTYIVANNNGISLNAQKLLAR